MSNKIQSLGIITILGFLIFIIGSFLPEDNDIKDLCISASASAIIVVFIEVLQMIIENKKMAFLKGSYKRVKITNAMDERDESGIYEDLTERYNNKSVASKIVINHCGGGRYTGNASYEEGNVKFDLSLDKENPSIGAGVYQYIDKMDKEGKRVDDIGTYTLQIDVTNKSRIFIYYQNILPNGLAKGYEIWERQ